MNIPKFSIDNFQFTITAFVLLLATGIYSYLTMPRSEDPVLDIPGALVVVIYPGASPSDIESQVVDPIEEAFNEIEDIEDVKTTITDGVAFFDLDFSFDVDNDDKVDEVQSQINSIRDELPENLYKIDTEKKSTASVPIFQLALVSEQASYRKMKEEGERVKKMIEKINGVRKVKIDAYPEQEVRVAIDPVKTGEMKISLEDIERAIQSNNANIPGGAIKISKKLFNIKTSGAYSTIEQIRNTVVGAFQGRIIYLKNIAAVYMDYEDEKYFARYNGMRSIVMTVEQKEGFNIFDIADPVKEKINNFPLAEDIQIEYVFDQSEGVKERINTFTGNLLQGVLLVGLIIFLVLGWRSASIIMMAIPFSILIGLWVVNIFELGLQQMSITGMIVALGLLVDNSIAITENIERFLNQGYSRKEAAIQGTSQLIAPMFSATLTTILAFVPVIMMPDTTGEFIKAMPISVIATLMGSFLIAVTLTPYIASKLLKERTEGATSQSASFKLMSRFVSGPYNRVLNWAFRHKFFSLGLGIASVVIAFLLFPLVGVTFFPKAEKPQFRVIINLPNGNNLDATDEAVRYVESVLAEEEAVDYYFSNIGHGNPRIYYNTFSKNYSDTYGDIFVVLKSYSPGSFNALLEKLRTTFSSYSNARIDIREFIQGPPSEAPIAIKIYGDDLDKLQMYAGKVEQIASKHPGAINIDNPLATNSTDLFFNINRDKAMMLGVPIHVVDKTIRSFVNGNPVAQFKDTDSEEYNIVLRYDFDKKFELKDFDKISVPSVSKNFIPLRQLANIELAEAPNLISHLDNDRVASVLGDIANGYTLDGLVADLSTEMDQLEWEEGYSYEFKGDLEKREQSFGGMGIASVLALILILGVLIIQFKSFSQPLIIFSALPLAIIGSILLLLATGVSFSFTAFIGLVSLIGISINNSIVLVDFANKLREEGKTVEEAAKEAGRVRFIPIVLTTLTTILGLLPLTLSGGSMWAPMGWTIIGGLLTSTFFVLFLVPIIYLLLTKSTTGQLNHV